MWTFNVGPTYIELGDLWQREIDDLFAYYGDMDIYSRVSRSCFTFRNLYPPSKGLRSHFTKPKVEEDDYDPRIASYRAAKVLND